MGDRLRRLTYVDTKVWLPDDLLMKVDKMTMAHSLEARTPFLDHRLVEYVATLPTSLLLNHRGPKVILKEVAREILPPEIIDRPKHTFDVPIGRWLMGDLRELVFDLLSQGCVAGERLFNADYILGEMWRGLEARKPGYPRQLWTLLNLALWARQYDVLVA